MHIQRVKAHGSNSKFSFNMKTSILILILEFYFIVTVFNQVHQNIAYITVTIRIKKHIPGQENPDSNQYY